MREVFDTYARASGQHVNYEKSAVSFSANVNQQHRQEITDVLGVSEGETNARYLGLPSVVGRRKKSILAFVKDRILAKIRGWNAKLLSRAGQEILLKNVIQSMPVYAMMVFLLPVGLCSEIETILNEYWWTGRVGNGKGIQWWSWAGLCAPKSAGGLGFRRLHDMNVALIGKQAWRLITRPESLVARVFKGRYYLHSTYFEATEGNNPSFVWRSILAAKQIVQKGCRRYIGNGDGTAIGYAPWLPSDEQPYVESELHASIAGAPVSSMFNQQRTGWDEECVRDIFSDRDVRLILSVPISLRQPEDGWYWCWDAKGNYTVKSGYRQLTTVEGETWPWLKIWNAEVPPKVKAFCWQLASHYLPTRDALATKRVYCAALCHMCQNQNESASHMFISCPVIMAVWNRLGVDIDDAVQEVRCWFFRCMEVLRRDRRAEFMVVCWAVWTSRNESVWNGVRCDPEVMVRRALVFLANWKAANAQGVPRANQGAAERWKPLTTGMLKLNIAAAVHANPSEMGLGWVLRGDDGQFMAAKNKRVQGGCTVREAGAPSVREALSWLMGLGFGNVEVEMNSQVVFNALHAPYFLSSFGLLVDDIQNLATSIGGVQFYVVKRSANSVAHAMARGVLSESGHGEWFDTPPPYLVDCLHHDLMN